jgi:hypothetical protein
LLGSICFHHAERTLVQDLSGPLHVLDPPGLEQGSDALDQILDDLVFSGHHASQIILNRPLDRQA